MGSALVNVNTPQLQRLFDLSADQVAWLSTSYVMTAVSANLLLIKVRQQYGLRRFALFFLGLYAALALAHLFVSDLGATLLLRATSGFVAVALIPLCLFHMMQAFPSEWRLRGLVLGIGVTQCAMPLARVILLKPGLDRFWVGSENWINSMVNYATKHVLEKKTSSGKLWSERLAGVTTQTKYHAYTVMESIRLERPRPNYRLRGENPPPFLA